MTGGIKNYLEKWDGWWRFVRHVPAVHAEPDRRGIVRLTTKAHVADDPQGPRRR